MLRMPVVVKPAEVLLQPRAQLLRYVSEMRGVSVLFLFRQFGGGAEPDDSRHILRTGAPVAFVRTTVDEIRQAGATADV